MEAVDVESPRSGRSAGIAMEFPSTDGTVSPVLPPRLRRRLSETKASTSSVEEIEAKLREADVRRQKFYEMLSNKARVKPRNLSKSSQEEEIAQRLQAKLHAAEQKRLSMLAKSQTRLAKLDALRQAAKTSAETRFKKELEELSSKVESRVQQAEINRMLILKSNKQRRATLRERKSESLLRRIVRESKYKESVRAAISQKRAAAEKNRVGLLESRVLKVREVPISISQKRDIESRKLKDKLEDRLQRARRQRAEYLMQRARLRSSVLWNTMEKQADFQSRKIARCWRKFLVMQRTTVDLTKSYNALNINETHMKSVPFEQLAVIIESPSTLKTTKVLLDRLDSRYKLSQAGNFSRWCEIDHLLKRVSSPKKRSSNKPAVWSSRYQVRVVLCAYMILAHPDAVFSGRGDREVALAEAAKKFVKEFDLLIRIVLSGPVYWGSEDVTKRWTFRSQLAAFDAAWCSYLNSFVVWKVKDAESLEEDLVKAACQLELSMMKKCKLTSEQDSDSLSHDLKAIQKQVIADQKLMREKIMHLSGDAGVERMKDALSGTRIKYFQAKESDSSAGSPLVYILPETVSSLSSNVSSDNTNLAQSNERPKSSVRSLFRDGLGNLAADNELIVNEVLHEHNHTFADSLSNDGEPDGVKVKVRETLMNAFWDGIGESMKQENPKYDRVIELLREVRDEMCEMAPQNWKEEISEAIDLEIISQVLNSGELDMDHLRKILEFALATLEKLSAPAQEDELKLAHNELLIELAQICESGGRSSSSHVIALIKGLRYVLEKIQSLKQEISKARIRIMEPMLKGPAGIDYLRKAFAKRYGPHSDALTALPLTRSWLVSVWPSKDQEWIEHKTSIHNLKNRQENSSQKLLPLTALRAGGSFFLKNENQGTSVSSSDTKGIYVGIDNQFTECKGEKVDLLVRLGLLKLVNGVADVAQEPLPETLKLNLSRLRTVQAQLQKVIVIATSVLVLKQTLLSEQIIVKAEDMETIILNCISKLSELLDTVEEAGIKEIIEILTEITQDHDKSTDSKKLESRNNVMEKMLKKSLQAEDPVFLLVSRAVYLAGRGFVLGGVSHGRELAELALRQVGATGLMSMVVEAAKMVAVVATVSVNVHGMWYQDLVEKM